MVNKDGYYLNIAKAVSLAGTCPRRQVGCVLVNSKGHIIATGYNGVARWLPHCSEHPCPGANKQSGEGLDACEAIHAEQNALLQCSDVHDIAACYVTVSPCIHCIKLLMNTSVKRIVFINEYHGSPKNQQLAEKASISWEQFSTN
jgi:dCMP deaminase